MCFIRFPYFFMVLFLLIFLHILRAAAHTHRQHLRRVCSVICIVSCGNCICQILVALHSYLARNTYSSYVDKLINLQPIPFFALSINAFFTTFLRLQIKRDTSGLVNLHIIAKRYFCICGAISCVAK